MGNFRLTRLIRNVQNDVGNASARTNLQTLLATLGNPDAAGATIWSALVGSNTSYNALLGTKVTRVSDDIFDGTSAGKAIFTVSGGRILLLNLSFEVTEAAIDNTTSNAKVISKPTVGTAKDLCANLDIDSDEEGTIYSITGTPTDALQGGSGGGANSMANGIIIPEGSIALATSADAASSGGAEGIAEMWYIPLDSGASVAAVAIT